MGTTNILDLNNRLEKVEKENVAQNNYNSLKNRPKINGNLLTGNKTTSDLGINADNVMMSDGVTSVEEAVDELKANIISGSTALSFDTEYTASSDGYVRGVVNNGSNKFVQIMLYLDSAGAYGVFARVGDTLNQGQVCTVYVRKGAKYKIQCSSTNDATCSFIPLS